MRWNEYVLIISLCTLTAAGWLKLVAFALQQELEKERE